MIAQPKNKGSFKRELTGWATFLLAITSLDGRVKWVL